MELNKTVAFVTGGAKGLGAAFVDALLVRGASKVYATSRTAFDHADPRVQTLVLDVTDPAAVKELAGKLTDTTLVINNAGFSSGSQVLGSDLSDLMAELQVNLFGLIHVADAFGPILAANNGGALLDVHSVRSWLANGTGYSISKAAAWSATNGIRLRFLEQGTLVTGLHVGPMDTDMIRHLDIVKSDPATVAGIALNGIEAGLDEVLADGVSVWAKAQLAGPLDSLFTELVKSETTKQG